LKAGRWDYADKPIGRGEDGKPFGGLRTEVDESNKYIELGEGGFAFILSAINRTDGKPISFAFKGDISEVFDLIEKKHGVLDYLSAYVNNFKNDRCEDLRSSLVLAAAPEGKIDTFKKIGVTQFLRHWNNLISPNNLTVIDAITPPSNPPQGSDPGEKRIFVDNDSRRILVIDPLGQLGAKPAVRKSPAG
jgi:hypothetical protein